MVWTEQDPGAGEPWGIRFQATRRTTRAEELRAAQVTLRDAESQAASAEWTAKSRDAFVAKLATIVPDVKLVIAGLDAQAAALLQYAAEVEQIKDLQYALTAQRDDAQSRLWTYQRQLRTSTDEDAPEALYMLTTRDHGQLERRIDDEQALLSGNATRWDELVARRRAADALCAGDLASRAVHGATAVFAGASARYLTPEALLDKLSGLSATDLAVLLADQPGLVDRLKGADPDAVAVWWAGRGTTGSGELSAGQLALIVGAPAVVGALNGLPPAVRVQANKALAQVQIERNNVEIERLEALRKMPDPGSHRATANDSQKVAELEAEIAELDAETEYLQRAVDGEVQLYLYDKDADRIIEMIGDFDRASTTVNYVPGTAASMESFTSGRVQEVAQWLIDNSVPAAGLVAFVYKDGTFPPNPVVHSPDNTWATSLGPAYHDFNEGLRTADGEGKPVISIEHSFGTSIAGKAETAGTEFAHRVSLSGIGMTEEWSANPGTQYSDFTGSNDVIRSVRGSQIGEIGYGQAPSEANGYQLHDSGLGASWQENVSKAVPVLGSWLDSGWGVQNHLTIAGDTDNATVLLGLREIVTDTQ
ncbi:hypothetical protein D6T64_21545 [Cryobacterium melibiosiphilum]|uniref:Alpha/beta hydrolase n=1 Tax=Cryobacterium melibiosiphilum TaxID=995039 RepID=A0A3A5MKF7_9MICO|nr:hypothetical protein [Cryobacterium melibiosiphilum]RJT84732.1 hypothetical protein D6T64_21545 [Cryobacterium melibiosiphilum]